MQRFVFGKTSIKRLTTVNEKLRAIIHLSLKRSPIDFGIACGGRTTKEQQELFVLGKSRCDGVTKISKHQILPDRPMSEAIDFWLNIKNKRWEYVHYGHAAGIIICAAQELKTPVRWGGNWDGDQDIAFDQRLIDMPHIELI